MRKMTILFFVLLFPYLSYAQEKDLGNEFFISCGAFPFIDHNFNPSYPDNFWGKPVFSVFPENRRGWSLNIGYSYFIARNFAIGLSYSYIVNKVDYRLPNAASIDATQKINSHTIMPNIKYQWLTLKHCTLYSKVGVGVAFGECQIIPDSTSPTQKTSEDVKIFTWQISPIGIEFGESVIVFFEGGIGTMGYLQAGVRLRL